MRERGWPDTGPHRRRSRTATVLLVLTGAAAFACAEPPPSPGGLGSGPSYRAQVSGISFECTLPVTTVSRAALLELPRGVVRVAASVQLPASAATNLPAFQRANPAYDARFARWIAGVMPQWIAPDGATYAQAGASPGAAGQPETSELDAVDVASGRRTRLWSGRGTATVLGFGPEGIYFSIRGPSQEVSEVWVAAADRSRPAHRVGPTAGRDPSQALPGFQLLGAGAAWAVAPPPFSPASPGTWSGLPSLILRMDLKTGVVTTYFGGRLGEELGLVGVDAQGEPIVTVLDATLGPNAGYFDSLPQVLLIEGDGARVVVSRVHEFFVPSSMVADEHGIWFGGPGSVWLYTPASGVQEVAKIPASALPLPARTPVARAVPSDYPFAGPSGQALLARLGPAVFIGGPCR